MLSELEHHRIEQALLIVLRYAPSLDTHAQVQFRSYAHRYGMNVSQGRNPLPSSGQAVPGLGPAKQPIHQFNAIMLHHLQYVGPHDIPVLVPEGNLLARLFYCTLGPQWPFDLVAAAQQHDGGACSGDNTSHKQSHKQRPS